jgi:hypothetical protein
MKENRIKKNNAFTVKKMIDLVTDDELQREIMEELSKEIDRDYLYEIAHGLKNNG